MANEQQLSIHNVDSVAELERLLSAGTNINELNAFDETPLLTALRRNVDSEVIRHFIQFGADVNAKDCWGVSPLYCALARHGKNLELIKLLLDYGADIESGKRINDRFLDHTVTHNLLCTKLLIKYKFLRNAHLLGLDVCFRLSTNSVNRNYYEEYKAVVDLDLKPSCYFYLRDFLDSCAVEAVRMSTVYVAESVTFSHFVTAISLGDISRGCGVRQIIDGVFEELLKNDYPIYIDIIVSKIGSEHLLGKICEQLQHHAPVGENFPYHVVLDYVSRHLNLGDLLDIVKALKYT